MIENVNENDQGTVRLYEGFFLINPVKIASNIGAATALVQELLDRAGAQTLSIAKWDERKLAYDIHGVKRGLFMLAYFKVDGGKIVGIERDVTLSENVMRCLILRADHVGETELEIARQEAEKTRHAAKLQGDAPATAAPTTHNSHEPAPVHANA